MSPYRDLTEREIFVGDYIVYSALWGRCAVLKYGKVVGLVEKKHEWRADEIEYKAKVVTVDRDHNDQWRAQANGRPITLGFLDRMMVVSPDQVPGEARAVIDGVAA